MVTGQRCICALTKNCDCSLKSLPDYFEEELIMKILTFEYCHLMSLKRLGFGQPGVVGNVPAHGRGSELGGLEGPFQPIL